MTIKHMKEWLMTMTQGMGRTSVVTVQQIIDALDELEWYRSQDLIRRQPVLDVMCDYIWDWNCGCEEAYEEIKKIPKVEPTNSSKIKQELNETKNERNGDCETCLHVHSTSQICEKCDGEDKYEPYIEEYKYTEPIAKIISKEETDDGLIINCKLTEYGKSAEVLEYLRKLGLEV